MDDLPAELFTDPAWHALNTRHSHLAVIEGDARRYPVDVAPFAALAKPTELALWSFIRSSRQVSLCGFLVLTTRTSRSYATRARWSVYRWC